MTQFVIGVDIGGTFTDAIVVADAGQVSLVGERGKVFLGCVSCGKKLGVAEDGYRHGCLELEIALETISPNFLSPKKRLMKTFFFRRFLCPGCGRPLDGQICRASDVPYSDVIVNRTAEDL